MRLFDASIYTDALTMNKTFYSFFLFVLLCIPTDFVSAQDQAITIGKRMIIPSTILGGNREIQIHLPKSYGESSDEFPVLYVLNGQRWFLYAVNLEETLHNLELTPEFIVVGISTNNEQGNARFAFFNQNSDKLLDFLKNELIPYIDSRYSTTDERLLFGWEYAGAFTIESIFQQPELFNAYMATSPFPVSGRRLDVIDSLLNVQLETDTFLYFAASANEGSVTDGASQLDSLLQAKAPASLQWTYQNLDYEESTGIAHLTTPFRGMYHGLRTYYEDYPDYTDYKNLVTTLVLTGILIVIVGIIFLGYRRLKKRRINIQGEA